MLVDASDGKTLAALEAAGAATIADRGSYRVLSLPNEAARNVAAAAGLMAGVAAVPVTVVIAAQRVVAAVAVAARAIAATAS